MASDELRLSSFFPGVDDECFDRLFDEVLSEVPVIPGNDGSFTITTLNNMALDDDNDHRKNHTYHATGECYDQPYFDTNRQLDGLDEPFSDFGTLGRTPSPAEPGTVVPVGEKRKATDGDEEVDSVQSKSFKHYLISVPSDVKITSFKFESNSSLTANVTDQQNPVVASHLDPKNRRLNKRRDAAVVRRAKTKAASGEDYLLISSMVNRAKALTPEQRDTLPGRLNQLINGESCDAEFFGGFCEEDSGKLEQCSEELRELQSALENAEKCVVEMENRLVLQRKKIGKPILEAEAKAVHEGTSKEQLIAELNQLQEMDIDSRPIDTIREKADRLGILCLALNLKIRNVKEMIKRLNTKKADDIRGNKLDELKKVEHLFGGL